MPETFTDRLSAASELTKTFLLTTIVDDGTSVAQAMRYAVQGGKGLRGFLVLESAAMFDIPRERALPAAAAIEAMHTYSLIHDDLPAMDDDDLRRGRPTVHIAFDEATAILAGDALQALAFDLIGQTDIPNRAKVVLMAKLAQAAGIRGMVGGQAMDIAAETADHPLSLDEITTLQDGKTGALFKWSATSGAIMADQDTAPLEKYAAAIGLAFQIADDVLDHSGDEAIAGKRLNKDAAAGKATFVSLLGFSEAKTKAKSLVDDARLALTAYGPRADGLIEAANFVINRNR